MSTWFRKMWQKKSPKSPKAAGARPQLECLESREVPTVTYHGGAVLQNVEAQALYFGGDWGTSAYTGLKGQLDNFLQYIVQSGYTNNMLGNAYGTGRGTFSSGQTYWGSLNKSQYLLDSTIRSTLQSCINAGAVQQPDSNRLYVVYVEDNVAVQNNNYWDSKVGRYDNSIQDFLGYHQAFAGTDEWGNAQEIHYAVVTYPGGTVGNAGMSWLTTLNNLTEVTSHELAEAITDPNIGDSSKALGWYDNNLGEVGDVCNGQIAYLAGYAVQRIADQNDQPMTPYSVGPERPVQFVLMSGVNGNNLWEHSASGWTFVSSGVTSVSDQGIDNYGRAMVDYLTTGGYAYEYHDLSGSTYLCASAVQAKAGQGVSYLLQSNGSLWEYHDSSFSSTSGSWSYLYNSTSIQQIDAGTDKYGVNAVDVLFTGGNAWMRSDTDGWHFLASYVSQVSGGQQGLVGLLDQWGNVYSYNEWSGSTTWMTSGARQVQTGYDAWGHLIMNVVYNNAAAYQFNPGSTVGGYITGGVWQLSKDNLGQITVLYGGTDASYLDLAGPHSLISSGGVAVA